MNGNCQPNSCANLPPPPLKPDKDAIKAAIQSGQAVPGAQLVNNTKLVIT